MSTRYISKVYECLYFAQFSLLPGTCVLCGKSTGRRYDFCRRCALELPRLERPCPRCALPLPIKSHLCGRCLSDPPPFRYAVSALDYRHPVDRLIGDFKYRAKLAAAAVLAGELHGALTRFYRDKPLPEVIIPVPLHSRRLRQRGFNQAVEIARPLARRLGIPVDHRLCRRRRNTRQQQGLQASERRGNLRRAFALNAPSTAPPYQSAAILDDVVTTMTTAAELSRLLISHGILEVHVWSLARTCRFHASHAGSQPAIQTTDKAAQTDRESGLW